MLRLVPILLTLVLTACGGGGGGTTAPAVTTSPLNKIINLNPNANNGVSMTNTVYNDAVGDLNNDGLMDVVVSGWNTDSTTAHIWVFIQNANGTLSDQTSTYLPSGVIQGSQHIFIVDLDHDGRNDIFVPGFRDGVQEYAADSIIFWNTPGQFSKYTFPTQAMAHGACLDDLDSDGNTDLIVGGAGVYINHGNRTFTLHPELLEGNLQFSACAVAHSPDGHVNLALANNNYCQNNVCSNSNLNINFSDNIFTFDAQLNFLTATGIVPHNNNTGWVAATAVDVNGDGAKDFIFAGNERDVYLNDGASGYNYSQTLDTMENSMYTYTLTVNSATVIFFSGNDTGDAVYRVTPTGLSLYNRPTAFTDMKALIGTTGWVAEAGTIYTGANGRVYIFKLLDNSFYTTELK